MPRYNVEVDGKWACFSSIPDAFITPFVPLGEYEQWRDEQYGLQKKPIEVANSMTLPQALRSLSLNKSDQEIVQNLRDAGLMYKPDDDDIEEEIADEVSP